MAFIKALTYHLPERELTNEQLQQLLPDVDVAKTAKAIGVETRHVTADGETAADLAVNAAFKLFEQYHIAPADVDFVIMCTQTPDYIIPSTSCLVQHRLGIPTTAGAVGIDLGCSGFVYGLMLADSLVTTGAASNVLLLTGDTPTKNLHHSDVNRILFGEAGTACLVANEGLAQIGKFDHGTDGGGADHLIIKTGASRHPQRTGSESVDDEGNPRRDDYTYMNGAAIFDFTVEHVPEMMQNIMAKNGIDADQVDYYVFHQANKFMLNTIRKIAGIPKDKYHVDLTHTGNTSCNTVPIGLVQALEAGKISKGSRVMVTGFGVGLSWAGTMLNF